MYLKHMQSKCKKKLEHEICDKRFHVNTLIIVSLKHILRAFRLTETFTYRSLHQQKYKLKDLWLYNSAEQSFTPDCAYLVDNI